MLHLTRNSVVIAYAVGIALAAAMVICHWFGVILVDNRLPYLFCLTFTTITAFVAGRGPALIVIGVGTINAILVLEPRFDFSIAQPGDRSALVFFTIATFCLLIGADKTRALYFRSRDNQELTRTAQAALRQRVADLEQLSGLSTKLALDISLQQRLQLILDVSVALHGASKGILSRFDPLSNRLSVVAIKGFNAGSFAQLTNLRAGEGACGLACGEGRRVTVFDVTHESEWEKFADLYRAEKIRGMHSTPIINQGGEILGVLSMHVTDPHLPSDREIQLADVCAQIAASYIERDRAQNMVRERDERFRSVLDASAVPFCIFSPIFEGEIPGDYQFTYVNTSAAHMLKRPVRGLLNAQVSQVAPALWSSAELRELLSKATMTQKIQRADIQISSRGLRWYNIVASSLESGVAVWFADITASKEREQQLRDSDRRKDEFLAALAHELRNPLAPIRQAAMIAQRSAPLDGDLRWSTEVIERQVQRMSMMLDDLIDVSRATRGMLRLNKSEADFASIISTAIETAQPIIDARWHQLDVEMPETPLRVLVDPLRLSQVISNLLHNAAQYTNIRGQIRLISYVTEKEIVIEVRDNGIGIEPNEFEAIFGLFSQGTTKRAQTGDEGLGIGLALSKAFIELHNGSITAYSEGAGQGSCFTLTLPRSVIVDTPTTADKTPPIDEMAPRRIVVADDNVDAAQSLALLLRLEGHHVDIAHDGKAALDLIENTVPDVAILDIGMPELDGYQVVENVRMKMSSSEIMLIASSGWGQQKNKDRAAEAGFDYHLTKPLEYSELRKIIASSSRVVWRQDQIPNDDENVPQTR